MTVVAKAFAAYDYVIGGWLIVMPWFFQFSNFFTPTVVSILLGLGIVVNGLFANNELGMVRFIPEYVHRLIDVVTGILLCIAPWLLGYHDIVIWPHVLTGLVYIMAVMLKKKAGKRRGQYH
jgi:hypothetical protein